MYVFPFQRYIFSFLIRTLHSQSESTITVYPNTIQQQNYCNFTRMLPLHIQLTELTNHSGSYIIYNNYRKPTIY